MKIKCCISIHGPSGLGMGTYICVGIFDLGSLQLGFELGEEQVGLALGPGERHAWLSSHQQHNLYSLIPLLRRASLTVSS